MTEARSNPVGSRKQFLGGLWRSLAVLVAAIMAPSAARARIPVTVVAPMQPWQSTEFEFEKDGRLLPGIAVRLPAANGGAGALYAACRICPHEGCTFALEREYDLVGSIVGQTLANPVFLCRCHLSVYDPLRDGAVVSGPARRPPWRFEIREESGSLEVLALEAGAGVIR